MLILGSKFEISKLAETYNHESVWGEGEEHWEREREGEEGRKKEK